ncbi:zinc knuckle CX2CX4HX4C containing protein, partial [Tanacetum coccineum]
FYVILKFDIIVLRVVFLIACVDDESRFLGSGNGCHGDEFGVVQTATASTKIIGNEGCVSTGFTDFIPMQNITTPICEPSKVADGTRKGTVDPDVAMTKNLVQSGRHHVINTMHILYFNVASPNSSPNGSATKNGSEQVGVVPPSYATKLRHTSLTTLAITVVEWFVHNNWEKYRLKKVTLVKSFFFFKFSSTECVDSVLRDGPLMIRKVPIFLINGRPINNLVMAVPNLEGTGYTKETIRVEYEWKPPRCSMCLIFGHSLDDCPKAPKRVVNKMDKGKGGSSKADDEGNGNFSVSNSFEALYVENLVREEVKTGNKASTSGVQEEGQSSTTRLSGIKTVGVRYGTRSLLEHVMEEEDHDKEIDYGIVSMGNMRLEDLSVNDEEIPFDTKSKIKVVKRFQPPQTDDENQITFLGPVCDEIDQLVDEPTDFDLHSMPDDDVELISRFEAADSNQEGIENTVDYILDEMADLKSFADKPLDTLGHLQAEISSLSNKFNNLESSLAKKVSSKMEESVPIKVADAFEEQMPELLSDALKNILPNIIKESIQQALPKFD